MRATKIISKKEAYHGPAAEVKIIQKASGEFCIDEKAEKVALNLLSALDEEQKRLDEIDASLGGGVGLASNQIENSETPLNMYVVNIREIRAQEVGCDPTPPTVFINARYEALADNASELKPEGCLSLQGIQHLQVPRHTKIKISAYVLNAATMTVEFKECEASGFTARVHQHEQDHCRGEEYLHCLNYDGNQLADIAAWIDANWGKEQKPGAVIIQGLSCSGVPDYAGLRAWVQEQ